MKTITICGQKFNTSIDHFSFEWPFQKITDMSELAKLKEFRSLKSASFGSTNLNDEGLQLVCNNTQIENIDLQETKITSDGLRFLAQLKGLKYLRLKDNLQLGNASVVHLNELHQLIDLQIHETSISHRGLAALSLPRLQDLILDIHKNNHTRETLLQLSRRLPNCTILAKGDSEYYQGELVWGK